MSFSPPKFSPPVLFPCRRRYLKELNGPLNNISLSTTKTNRYTVTQPWGDCSADCAGGIQSRKISCTMELCQTAMTTNMQQAQPDPICTFSHTDDNECEKRGIKRVAMGPEKRVCNEHPCYLQSAGFCSVNATASSAIGCMKIDLGGRLRRLEAADLVTIEEWERSNNNNDGMYYEYNGGRHGGWQQKDRGKSYFHGPSGELAMFDEDLHDGTALDDLFATNQRATSQRATSQHNHNHRALAIATPGLMTDASIPQGPDNPYGPYATDFGPHSQQLLMTALLCEVSCNRDDTCSAFSVQYFPTGKLRRCCLYRGTGSGDYIRKRSFLDPYQPALCREKLGMKTQNNCNCAYLAEFDIARNKDLCTSGGTSGKDRGAKCQFIPEHNSETRRSHELL